MNGAANGVARRASRSVTSRGRRIPLIRHGLMAVTFVLSALAFVPSTAKAQWGGEVRLQSGFGGDEVANVTYSDGSGSDLKLGRQDAFLVGPIFEAWSSAAGFLELQALVGWSGSSTGPENTDDRLRMNLFPLEMLAFYGYRFPGSELRIRAGGGIRYHYAGWIGGSGNLEGTDMDLASDLGTTGEVSLSNEILKGGFRYTRMSTDLEYQGTTTNRDSSSFSLFISMLLTPFF